MSIPAWLFDLAADLVADRETLVGVLAEWNVDPPDLAAVALTIGSTDSRRPMRSCGTSNRATTTCSRPTSAPAPTSTGAGTRGCRDGPLDPRRRRANDARGRAGPELPGDAAGNDGRTLPPMVPQRVRRDSRHAPRLRGDSRPDGAHPRRQAAGRRLDRRPARRHRPVVCPSARTRQKVTIVIRSFWAWMEEQGHIAISPAARIRWPGGARSHGYCP